MADEINFLILDDPLDKMRYCLLHGAGDCDKYHYYDVPNTCHGLHPRMDYGQGIRGAHTFSFGENRVSVRGNRTKMTQNPGLNFLTPTNWIGI